MIVTGLRAVRRPPGYVAVEVDGARVAVLPAEQVQALGLERGRPLNEVGVREVERAGAVEAAHRAAVKLLAVRDRATHELLARLRRKGLPPDVVAEVVGRLESAGLLHDARFAESFARARAERGYGRGRILADLAARGVARLVAERAVDGLSALDEDARAERIERLARKRAARLAGLPSEIRLRRLVGFLARRGYGGGDTLRIARRVVEAENGGHG